MEIELWILSPNLYHIRSNPDPHSPSVQGPICLPAFGTPASEGSPSKGVHREATLLVEAILEVSGQSFWARSPPKAQALHVGMAWILKFWTVGWKLELCNGSMEKKKLILGLIWSNGVGIWTGTRWIFEHWLGSSSSEIFQTRSAASPSTIKSNHDPWSESQNHC